MMAPDLRFRAAVLDDLPAIIDLLADDALGRGREQPGTPLAKGYLDAFAAIEASGRDELIVGLDETGTVVACLQLTIVDGLSRVGRRRGIIEAVRVDGRLRGHGIGTALVEHAIDRARTRGCGLVQLTSDRTRGDAHRFYERLGFVPSHVGMKRDLA